MDYRHSTDRLAAFECEFGTHPNYEFRHQEHGWRYLTNNPWGRWVTGYCAFDGDVHRLDCSLAADDELNRDGLYVEWYLGMPPYLRFWAFTDNETIDRNAYEHWMTRFRDATLDDPDRFGPGLGDGLVRIGVARSNTDNHAVNRSRR